MKPAHYTWKRFGLALGLSAFFVFMGFGVRYAEDGQVGYTNDTSMWVFGLAALCAYYALVILIVRWRMKRKGIKPKRPGYWD